MASLRARVLGAGVLLAAAWALAAPAAFAGGKAVDEEAVLAARIDELIAAGWSKAQVKPAAKADDSEFVRRVYIDLAGRIPSVTEVRTFLDDRSPNKRRQLVQRLLDSPRYVTHFARVWRSLMLPEADTNVQTRFLIPSFEAWLQKELRQNAPYDQMVRELLTAPVNGPGVNYFPGGQGQPMPTAFYQAKEFKPENLAAAASRLFLGVKLECAQCHNHPFASWKREQFWGMAAFFAGVQSRRQGDFVQPLNEIPDRRELTIPGTEKVVQAGFLDGTAPKWKYKESARTTLARWITKDNNPYFARATVNRLWCYFLGTGLIDPVDEMVGTDHTASHPELLDELARQFVAHKYDLKFLIRAITSSQAYQLSSAGASAGAEHSLFARMPLRGMTVDQLYDSVAQATGYQEAGNPNPFFFGPGSPRADFINRFGNQTERPTETQTSILQALSLMNGRLISTATSLERSETLAAIADAPFMDTRARIEALYLAALARKPKPRELARLAQYVESGGSAGLEGKLTDEEKTKRYNQALADVFWTLLNSGEFYLNH